MEMLMLLLMLLLSCLRGSGVAGAPVRQALRCCLLSASPGVGLTRRSGCVVPASRAAVRLFGSRDRRGSRGRKDRFGAAPRVKHAKQDVSEDEEDGDGSKPSHWPTNVVFSQKLKWSGTDKDLFKKRCLPGLEVKYITQKDHPLRGQYGVYATRAFQAFDVVGEYVGRVVDPEVDGEYVASIDYEGKRHLLGVDGLWGVDSRDYGNEARMINHFHGLAKHPNCKLVTAYVAELPHILVVVMRPIAVGEELLLDYGPNYWSVSYTPPGPDPLAPKWLREQLPGQIGQKRSEDGGTKYDQDDEASEGEKTEGT